MLSGHLADNLLYFRATYFTELFPTLKTGAQWILDYSDKAGQMPSMKEFKRANPKALPARPSKPEPLVVLMDDLREELAEDVARESAQEMDTAFQSKDLEKFAQLGESMTDKLALIRAPMDAQIIDTDQHTSALLAEIDAGRGVGKVIPSGFEPLDRELGGGFSGGRLYTLAALIHLGKTYVTTQFATHARKLGHRALYISLEMASPDIAEMSLCLRYRMNVNHYIKRDQPQDSIDSGETKEAWLKRILEQRQSLEDVDNCEGKVFIQGSEMGLNCARNIRSIAKEKDVDIIYIDACQDIQANAPVRERTANLYMALAELNSLAVGLGIPLVMTVQLSAEVEKKGITANNLANIQWGQVFSQKSHAVFIMLGDRTSDVRDVTVEKNRGGVSGAKFEVHMVFPEIRIYATSLQAGGLTLTEDEIFEDADDIDLVKNIQAQVSNYSPLNEDDEEDEDPIQTARNLQASIQEDEEEETEYQKKAAARKLKRTNKRKLRKRNNE